MPTDLELLARAQAGERAAWSELVRLHCPAVRRFYRTMTPPEAVDDLTQETFLRLERAFAAQREVLSFRSFLFGIARNVLHEFIRERTRSTRNLDDVSAVDLDPRPSSVLVARADRAALVEALRHLTIQHQLVLQLFYWEDMTTAEIAAVLDENENTIRGRVTRARARLRELLAQFDRQGMVPRASDAEFDAFASATREHVGG